MFQALLARIARGLDAARIPYMVVGGQAVLVHGQPRLTRDIDITLGIDATALNTVRSLADSLGLLPSVSDVEAFVRRTNVIPLTDSSTGLRVDMIFSFTPYESEAIRRAVTITFDEGTVRFASAEDLIIHKLVAGRPRDIEDIAGVLARLPSLDEEYLTRWLATFRETVQRDLVHEFNTLRRNPELR
jgi:hypothetical protein